MESKLKQIMSNLFGIKEDKVEESSMDTIEDWDSLRHLSLIIAIEEHFSISLNEDEVNEMTNYPNIKRILRNKVIGDRG